MRLFKNFLAWFVRKDKVAPADAILVLDGGEQGNRMAVGLDLLRQGCAPRLLVSQAGFGYEELYPPIVTERAEIRADPAVRAQGDRIEWITSNALSTLEEATAAREVLKRLGCATVLVVTSSYHARRAREIYSRLLLRDGIEVHVFPAPVPEVDAMPWWKSKAGCALVLYEFIKLLSTLCHLDGHVPKGLRFRLKAWADRIAQRLIWGSR
jgi:uncharacterized SAM-binding protein YcdF (DUF218 family)